jgi:hypothetical protein
MTGTADRGRRRRREDSVGVGIQTLQGFLSPSAPHFSHRWWAQLQTSAEAAALDNSSVFFTSPQPEQAANYDNNCIDK